MPTALVTAPPETAATIARTLVEERLAGGVNRISCDSVFRWDGEVREADEELLLVQTTAEAYDDCVARILELHPYEVPCVERFDAIDVHPPFSSWLADVTGGDGESGDETADDPHDGE